MNNFAVSKKQFTCKFKLNGEILKFVRFFKKHLICRFFELLLYKTQDMKAVHDKTN